MEALAPSLLLKATAPAQLGGSGSLPGVSLRPLSLPQAIHSPSSH